jgi:hypothetical protein
MVVGIAGNLVGACCLHRQDQSVWVGELLCVCVLKRNVWRGDRKRTDVSSRPATTVDRKICAIYIHNNSLTYTFQPWRQRQHAPLKHQHHPTTWCSNQRTELISMTNCHHNIRTWQSLLEICFHACFLLGLFFNPEYGGDMLLWNNSWLSPGYMALHYRICNSS